MNLANLQNRKEYKWGKYDFNYKCFCVTESEPTVEPGCTAVCRWELSSFQEEQKQNT